MLPSKPPSNRGGLRTRLPALDVATLQATDGDALPSPRMSRRGETAYDALFAKLHAPNMAVRGIPLAYLATLTKAAQTYCKARPGLVLKLRRIPDTDTCGVWRLADATPSATTTSPARQPA